MSSTHQHLDTSSNTCTLLGHPILQGWMLKKKRKKMQGFARRYFYLSQEPAVLSYSFSPNSRIRDSVLIKLASISISRKSRSIHIDSGSSLVMHIRTLTDLDFMRWTSTLQSLVTGGNLKEFQTTRRQPSKDSSKPLPKSSQFLRSDAGPSVRPVELSNLYHSVARMQAPLSMLEQVQNDFRQLFSPPSDSSYGPQSQIHSRSTSSSQVPSGQATASHNKFHASLPKGKKAILSRHQSQPRTITPHDPQKVYQVLNQAIDQLKAEHLNLIDLINTHRTSMVVDQAPKLYQTLPRINPPITRNNRSSTSPNSFGSDYMTPSSATSSSIPPPRRRSSTLTKSSHRINQDAADKSGPLVVGVRHPSDDEGVESENDTIFHDAHDLVFVDLDLLNNGHETELEMMGNQDSSSMNDSDSDDGSSSSRELDDDEEQQKLEENNKNITIDSSSNQDSLRVNLDSTSPGNLANSPSPYFNLTQPINRRSTLPSPVCGDEFSIFSMLKKNVGKDLSQISFPISFNEPLSATQKICEDCEYVDELIVKAVKAGTSSLERLMYIAGYVVSGFCHSKTRAIRKPFNPMWGETYECIRPDKGMKFLSEKVVHHPPLIAAYAEGENWKLEINSSARQKFWGQSLEIIPEGINRLTIFNNSTYDSSSPPTEVYEWEKPSSFVRNLVSGTKYLEHIGKVTILKKGSEEKATIEFKPGSTFGGESSRNKVEIKVYDQEGRVGIIVDGKWDSNLIRSDNKQKIFQAHSLPNRSQEYYGFTKFAIELNELTEDLMKINDSNPSQSSNNNNHQFLLPNTDSRFRPDLRAFENGQVELADSIKSQLEEKQRNRRKNLDQSSIDSSSSNLQSKIPLWFQLDESGKNWVYKGGYFENRQKENPEWIDLDLF